MFYVVITWVLQMFGPVHQGDGVCPSIPHNVSTLSFTKQLIIALYLKFHHPIPWMCV